MKQEDASLPARRSVRLLAPIALFATAFAVRGLNVHEILIQGRTLFFGNDAYYHMRRIAYSIVRFPDVLTRDPYINYPDGGEPIWTPAFDWIAAALLRPFWRALGPDGVERLAVFLPPLLGAATVVVAYRLARRNFGAATGATAGAILCVLSGHVWYSQAGFIDHHAAVSLVATIALAAAMNLVASAAEPRVRPARMFATGAAIAACLLIWPGCLLHVALLEVGLVATALALRVREVAVRFAWTLAGTHATAAVLVAPASLGADWTAWGPFSPVVLSNFQPWFLALGASAAAACAVLWRAGAAGGTRRTRAFVAVLASGGLLGIGVAARPESIAALRDAWEWFARADDFQHQVAESLPLFWDGDRFTWVPAMTRLSAFFPLLPIALAIGAVRAARRENPAPTLLLLGWCLGLAVAACFQRRFFNTAAVGVGIVFALSLVATTRALAARLPPRLRAAAAIGVASAGLFALMPSLNSYAWHLANQLRWIRGEPTRPMPRTHQRAAVVEMGSWMRVGTPAPSSWLDPGRTPAYGVLAPWTIGHILVYEGRRPTVTNNFGDDLGRENFLLARRYYQSAEPAAVAILERLRVRYVVAQRAPNYLGEDPVPGSVFESLFARDGSADADARAGDSGAPALARHRLVFDARPLAGDEPTYKVFELVRGARVAGRARPGARIRAELPVRTNRGRAFVYRTSARATPEGLYELVLPYSTRGGPPGIRVAPVYRLDCDGDRGGVEIDEAAVMEGARVPGPALCDDTAGATRARPPA